MYYLQLETLIKEIINNEIDKEIVLKRLIDEFEWGKIYDSNDMLLTDSFFTIKHYASGEEIISNIEWKYLLECLQGKQRYDKEEKNEIIRKSHF